MAGASRVGVTRDAEGNPQIPTRTPTYGALVGVAEMGPIGSAFPDATNRDPVTSWAAWQAIYGGFTANAQHLPLAAKSFFDEGGQYLYTSRVVHCATPGDPTSRTSAAATLQLLTAVVAASAGALLGSVVGPFTLTHNAALNIAIDGGSPVAATFSATAPSRSSGNGPFALSNGQTITASINGQAVTFTFTTSQFGTIGAATAAEVAAAMNGKLASLNPSARAVASVSGSAVVLTSTWLGTGASINITGGTANGALGFTTGAVAGTGNVADIAAVTVAEVKSVVEGAVAGCTVTNVAGAAKITSQTTGTGSSVQVVSSGSTASAVSALGFDNAVHAGGAAGALPTLQIDGLWDGTYAHAYSPRVSAPASGLANRFDFALVKAGKVVESWKDASMDPASPNYIETLVNVGTATQRKSTRIKVTDLAAAFPLGYTDPATGTFGPLSGGNDGLSGLSDADFYGSTDGAGGATGLHVFDRINRVDVVAIPGRCTPAAHAQTVTWCEVYREGLTFAIIAIPSGYSIAQARTYVGTTAGLQELTEIGAAYGPWIYQDNPNPAVFGAAKTILVPPEGAIMGCYATNDASKEGGAFEHPSNARGKLKTARGVEHDEYEDRGQRGLAFDALINAIRATRGKGVYIDGARCLKSTGPFPTVGQSRGAMLVSANLIEAYDDLRNAGIRDGLFVQLETGARVYLGKLTKAGCFSSRVPAESFFVDFGKGLNTPDVSEARTVLGTVGLGGPPPAEFIFVTVTNFSGTAALYQKQVQQASPGGV